MQRVKDSLTSLFAVYVCLYVFFCFVGVWVFFNENLGCGGPMGRICLLESTTLEQLTDVSLPCVGHCG